MFIALASFLMAAAQLAEARCGAIPGWDQVLANEKIRWIVIGELHGNNETPKIFADAVCLTARSRRVVVAIEQSAGDQPAIDAFMASDGGENAKRVFLGAPMWNSEFKDGRSSEAYFRLFEDLRRMRAAGQITGVVAFQPYALNGPFSPSAYETEMARLLHSAGPLDATVVALVGNIHAMRTEVSFETRYMPMAGHLPREATVTLNTVGQGGQSWTCHGAPTCGPDTYPNREMGRPRGVSLSPDAQGAYSGALVLGVPITASPPQKGTGLTKMAP